MSKHTPGPWQAGKPDGSCHDVIRVFGPGKGEGDVPIAVVPQQQSAVMSVLSGQTNETTEAAHNARLIAACPDMYAVLKNLWGKFDNLKDCSCDGAPDGNGACFFHKHEDAILNAIAKAEGK